MKNRTIYITEFDKKRLEKLLIPAQNKDKRIKDRHGGKEQMQQVEERH